MSKKRKISLQVCFIVVLALVFLGIFPTYHASAKQVSGNSVDENGNIIEPEPIKILLIGNSLTKCTKNRDGRTVQEYLEYMADASGKSVYVKSVAYGGASLRNYVGINSNRRRRKRAFRKALKAAEWDYVVLQELSKFYYKRSETESAPAVEEIISRIEENSPDAQMLLYVPRGYDLISKRAKNQMDAKKMECYMGAGGERLANMFDIPVVPVGMHFYRCSIKYPEIKLMGPDKRHPTRAGYFLAASCIYQEIFGEKPQINEKVLKQSKLSKQEAFGIIDLWGDGIVSDAIEVCMKKGEVHRMEVTDARGNKVDDVRFMSLDKTVAEVDEVTGEITALRQGATVVVAETVDGWQTYCTVCIPYSVPKKLRASTEMIVQEDGLQRGKVTLQWKKQGGAMYEVYRATSRRGSYRLLGRVSGNSYVDNDLSTGKTWYYKVRAVNDYELCASKKTKAIKVSFYR